MDRLGSVWEAVDDILLAQPNRKQSRSGFVHLYGVAATSSLLAIRRVLDPQLSAMAGMLHDISTYRTGDALDHARLSSNQARRLLTELGCFSGEEITIICGAISSHSRKNEVGKVYDELLKDADVLQHYLYNTSIPPTAKERKRLASVLGELGIQER